MDFRSAIQKFIQNLTLGIQNNLISDCFGLFRIGVRSEVVSGTLLSRFGYTLRSFEVHSPNGVTTDLQRRKSEPTAKEERTIHSQRNVYVLF